MLTCIPTYVNKRPCFAYMYTLDITLAKMSHVVVFAKTVKVHICSCVLSFSKIHQSWASRYIYNYYFIQLMWQIR